MKNTMGGSLVIGTVGFTGNNPGDFIKTSDGCTGQTLAANVSCTIQVSFNPLLAGAKTANLAIPSNDANTPTFNGTLNGIAAVPRLLSISRIGSGIGSVTSAPAGISCGTTCSSSFTDGTTVVLTSTPDVNSSFTGWSGGGCSGSGTCTVTLNADTTISTTFTSLPTAPPVRLARPTPVYFSSLQSAYDASISGDIIQAQALIFTEDLVTGQSISVTIDGGYTSDFSSNPGKTTIKGNPHINSGTITMKNCIISN